MYISLSEEKNLFQKNKYRNLFSNVPHVPLSLSPLNISSENSFCL